MYYILLPDGIDRQKVLTDLKQNNIFSVFHYVPLHSSPAGKRYGRVHDSMQVTITQSERLIRLPLWVGLSQEQQDIVVETLYQSIN
jgi:dTDP-4-amino-4,6-dideoxygalactose transaminase